jgi:hypothetical protein
VPDRWLNVPERAPFKCVFTQQDSAAAGPYFEARLTYFPAEVDEDSIRPGRHPNQLYLSGQAIKEACELPGSPLVCLSKEQYAELENRLLEANEQITALLDDAVEREALSKALDPAEIAKAVAENLTDTFARKTGPKAKAAA